MAGLVAHPGGGDRLPVDRRVTGVAARVVLPDHRAVAGIRWPAAESGRRRCAACRSGGSSRCGSPTAASMPSPTSRRRCGFPRQRVAHVSALSPAGEQFINLEAASDIGPYLRDGSVIALDRTTVPVSMAQLLSDADGLLAQVDPHKVELIKKELSLSKEGPAEAGRHCRRRNVPAVDAGFGAAPNHQHHQDQPGRADARGRQERRAGRDVRESQPNAGRRRQNAGRLSPVDRAGTARPVRRRQLVRRQLRHHGAAAGQHGHRVTAAVSAGAGAQRAVPELPRLGAGRGGQRRFTTTVSGRPPTSTPATPATTAPRRIRPRPPTITSRSCTPTAATTTPAS